MMRYDERDEIKRRRYLSKTDLSAFHGAKPSIHYPPKRNMEFRTNILLIPARIYQYALTLLILLQEAQLNHTTGLA